MENIGIRDNSRLMANPMAVARHAHALPSVALALIRLLDGRRTLRDALRYSPVEEETARAVIRRCCELGLVEPIHRAETPVTELSPALQDWLQQAGMRIVNDADGTLGASEDPAAELAAALAEDPALHLTERPADGTLQEAAPYEGLSGEQVCTDAGPVAPAPPDPPAPGTLQEAIVAHLEPTPEPATLPMAAVTATPVATPTFSEDELAFFDSYVPEEPMVDTFSDLVSAPIRRR